MTLPGQEGGQSVKSTLTVPVFLLQGAKGETGSDGATVSECEPDNELALALASQRFFFIFTSTGYKALGSLL